MVALEERSKSHQYHQKSSSRYVMAGAVETKVLEIFHVSTHMYNSRFSLFKSTLAEHASPNGTVFIPRWFIVINACSISLFCFKNYIQSGCVCFKSQDSSLKSFPRAICL